jgi:hypothetical protein
MKEKRRQNLFNVSRLLPRITFILRMIDFWWSNFLKPMMVANQNPTLMSKFASEDVFFIYYLDIENSVPK